MEVVERKRWIGKAGRVSEAVEGMDGGEGGGEDGEARDGEGKSRRVVGKCAGGKV